MVTSFSNPMCAYSRSLSNVIKLSLFSHRHTWFYIFWLNRICPGSFPSWGFTEFIFPDSSFPRGRLHVSGTPLQGPSSLATTPPTSWPGVATLAWRRPTCLSRRASVRATVDLAKTILSVSVFNHYRCTMSLSALSPFNSLKIQPHKMFEQIWPLTFRKQEHIKGWT